MTVTQSLYTQHTAHQFREGVLINNFIHNKKMPMMIYEIVSVLLWIDRYLHENCRSMRIINTDGDCLTFRPLMGFWSLGLGLVLWRCILLVWYSVASALSCCLSCSMHCMKQRVTRCHSDLINSLNSAIMHCLSGSLWSHILIMQKDEC